MDEGRVGQRVLRLVAKDQIRDVIYRYCRGIDRLDLEMVRNCYHPDATDLHGSFRGGVEEYLAWVEPLLRRYDRTFHFIGNVVIELDDASGSSGDDPTCALVESYGIAHHENAGGPDHQNLVTGFRFIDRFEDRGGGWRIAQRTATTEWSRRDPETGWWPIAESFLRGARDGTDPLYGLEP